MASVLIIVLSVVIAALALAFVIALGRVSRRADLQMQRHAMWARAHGTLTRELPISVPSPRTNAGAMRLPVNVSLPLTSRAPDDDRQPPRIAGIDLGVMSSLRTSRVGTPTGMSAWIAGHARRRRTS